MTTCFNNIRIRIIDGVKWYNVNDVGSMCHMKNIRSVMATKVTVNNKRKLQEVTNGGPQTVTYANLDGIKQLIYNSRCPGLAQLGDCLGINIIDYHFACKETSVVNALRKAFPEQQVITQFGLNEYRYDIFFQDLKLIIEVDEDYHNKPQQQQVDGQKNFVIESSDIKLLRFKATDCIFTLIGKIRGIISA